MIYAITQTTSPNPLPPDFVNIFIAGLKLLAQFMEAVSTGSTRRLRAGATSRIYPTFTN